MLLACPIGSETGKLGRGSEDCTSLQSQRKLAVATIVQQLHPGRGLSVKKWIVDTHSKYLFQPTVIASQMCMFLQAGTASETNAEFFGVMSYGLDKGKN